MAKISTQILDLERSMNFDKELFLDDLVNSMHTTRSEFERIFILEEFPMVITMEDFTLFPTVPTALTITTAQQFHIRLKTAEEMTEDISRHITQGDN